MYLEIIGDGGFELPSVIEAISSHSNRLDEFDKLHLTPMVCINIIIFISLVDYSIVGYIMKNITSGLNM